MNCFFCERIPDRYVWSDGDDVHSPLLPLRDATTASVGEEAIAYYNDRMKCLSRVHIAAGTIFSLAFSSAVGTFYKAWDDSDNSLWTYYVPATVVCVVSALYLKDRLDEWLYLKGEKEKWCVSVETFNAACSKEA